MTGWDDINVYDFRLGNLDTYAVRSNGALHLTAEKNKEDDLTVSYRFRLYDISGKVLEKFEISDDAENFRHFREGVRYLVFRHMVGHISKVYRIEKDTDRNILSHLYLKQYPGAEKISSKLPSDISITASKVCIQGPDGTVIGVEKKKEAACFRFVLFSEHGSVLSEGDVGDTEEEKGEYSARDALAVTAYKAGYAKDDQFKKIGVEKYLDEYDFQNYLKQRIAKKQNGRTIR